MVDQTEKAVAGLSGEKRQQAAAVHTLRVVGALKETVALTQGQAL
jgi:hypothetical protein